MLRFNRPISAQYDIIENTETGERIVGYSLTTDLSSPRTNNCGYPNTLSINPALGNNGACVFNGSLDGTTSCDDFVALRMCLQDFCNNNCETACEALLDSADILCTQSGLNGPDGCQYQVYNVGYWYCPNTIPNIPQVLSPTMVTPPKRLSDTGSFIGLTVPVSSQSVFINIDNYPIYAAIADAFSKNTPTLYLRCKVFLESVEYNYPWTFRLEPDAVVAVSDIQQERLGLDPATLQDLLSANNIANGSYVYYLLSGQFRYIDKTGLQECTGPLSMKTRRILINNKEFMEGYCDGPCVDKTNNGFIGYCPEYDQYIFDSKIENIMSNIRKLVEAQEIPLTDVFFRVYLETLTEEEKNEYLNLANQLEQIIDNDFLSSPPHDLDSDNWLEVSFD